MWDQLTTYLLGSLAILIPVLSTCHILLTKDDVRAAIGWMGLVWLVPGFGALLYMVLGVNRIRRRAVRERSARGLEPASDGAGPAEDAAAAPPPLIELVPPSLAAHARLVGTVTGNPLTAGNAVTPLVGGDAAYDAMLAAIDGAERSVALTTYIFKADAAGVRFVEALDRAVRRGVAVRVLIDGVGQLYGWPPIARLLTRRGVCVRTFNPLLLSWRLAFLNLRTHRKLLVVDGRIGFTGGMNIRAGTLAGSDAMRGVRPLRDLQFRIAGPLVAQLMEAFADDWLFAAGETLGDDRWFPPLAPVDSRTVIARTIPDGPDQISTKTAWTMASALASARDRVHILTPYFLPDAALITALQGAALRGVTVDIVLPGHNNLAVVKWASHKSYDRLLRRGCRIWHGPPPFNHAKLMVVDRLWVLFGSTNWDARSLRLNFEFNVECYDQALAADLARLIDDEIAGAQAVTLADVDARPTHIKLRDGVAWLLSPYL